MIFTAYGKPQPQGSLSTFVNRRTGRNVVTSDNPNLKAWRESVGWAAKGSPEFTGRLILGPVAVGIAIYLSRPASRAKRYTLPDRKPDIDKVTRAVLDAITAVLIGDDAQVCSLVVNKFYANAGDAPHVVVEVASMNSSDDAST